MLEQVDKTKFTWVAWDPPGYGKSRPPTRDFSDAYLRKDAILAAKLMEVLISVTCIVNFVRIVS